MGVEITVWRVKIGTFMMPDKRRCAFRGIKVPSAYISQGLRWIVVLSILLLNSGDVESNPGPSDRTGRTSKQKDSSNINASDNINVSHTRQRTLSSSFSLSQPTGNRRQSRTDSATDITMLSQQVERRRNTGSTGTTASQVTTGVTNAFSPAHSSHSSDEGSMFDFLRQMKHDLVSQNNRVTDELRIVNTKIDSLTDSVLQLKSENEKLRDENQILRSEVTAMKDVLDKVENQSRRNNLRIDGIPGSISENWTDTENKVRDFIKNELGLPDKELVEIERAHRVRSKNPAVCTTVVKFSKYKDRECILNAANTSLARDSVYTVRPDYTDRIKRHRRELGSRMIEERQRNNYAVLRYDKLIINDKVFKFDDATNSIVCIGRRHNTRRTYGDGLASGGHVTAEALPVGPALDIGPTESDID